MAKTKKTPIKRPRITEDVKKAVSVLHRQGLSVGEIFELRKKLGFKAPSLRSLQDIVTEAKEVENTPEFQQLGQPWHLGLLRDYPHISAEAVAKIFELKAKGLDYLDVRTAQWISRLSLLHLSVDVLYVFAWIAAYEEKILDLANLPRDTDALTFEGRLLAVLQNPDKARWTMARWEKPLGDTPELRKMTQKVLSKFYPIVIHPTLAELEGTPELERWKLGRNTSENKKAIKQMHQQQWEQRERSKTE